MDRMEEYTAPIRRALEAHPAYTLVALSLGFSVYRWNTTRVGYCSRRQLTVLKIASRSKFPHMDQKFQF